MTRRILHVVPTYWPAVRYGGTIVSTRALVAAQVAAGHDVTVAAGHDVTVATTSVDGPGDRRDLEGDARDVDGARIHYFPCGFPRRLYRSPALGAWLDRHAAGVDVIHAHAAYLWPTWRAGLAARTARVPFVYSPRGMLARPLIAGRNALVKRAWIALVERRTLARTDVIHFTSEAEAASFADLGLTGPRAQVVIGNGVALPSRDALPPRDANHVVYLGRLSWEKRVEPLIDAIARVPAARLTVAGDDAGDGLRAALTTRAAAAGIADRVAFVGAVDAAARTELLHRAAIVVMPSIAESFGNVATEAMAHGCAVIVSPGVGARTLVVAQDAGAVVEPTPDALAAVLQRWIVDEPDATRARGERGRAFAFAALDWSRIAARMDDAYDEARARAQAGHVR